MHSLAHLKSAWFLQGMYISLASMSSKHTCKCFAEVITGLMLLWPAGNRAPGATIPLHLESQYSCGGRDICAAPLQCISSLKSQIIYAEKTRLITSIASSRVCSMQGASSWRKSAGKAAVKMHWTSHGVSTVCFHHDQKMLDRKKSTSRTRKGIFLFEYSTTDCKAISKSSFLHKIILKMDRVNQMCGSCN